MATVTDEVLTIFRVLGEREVQAAYARAAGSADIYGSRLDQLRHKQIVAGATFAAGITALGFFAGAALDAAQEQEAFNRAAGNFRGQLPAGEVEQFAGELSKLTGIDDGKIANTLGILGTFQISPEGAKSLTLPILNATEALKALGLTSEQTAAQVGKALQTGSATGLRRAGIVIDQEEFRRAGTEAERLRIIIAALNAQGGQAAVDFRKTLGGSLQALTTEFGNFREGIGEGGIGPLKTLSDAGVGVLQTFNALPDPIKQTAGLIGVGLAGAVTVYSARTVYALGQTIHLAKAHLEAAKGAGVQAAAEDRLAGSLARVAGASKGVAGSLAGRPSSFNMQFATTPQVSRPLPGAVFGGAAAAGNMMAGGAAAAAAAKAGGTRFLGGVGGAATVAGLAGLGLSFLPDTGNQGVDRGIDIAGGALQGAGIGAAVGSIIPGVGTAAGAGIGAAVGGGASFLGQQAEDEAKRKAAEAEKKTEKSESDKDRQIAKLEAIIEELRAIRREGKMPLDTSDLSGRDQMEAIL